MSESSTAEQPSTTPPPRNTRVKTTPNPSTTTSDLSTISKFTPSDTVASESRNTISEFSIFTNPSGIVPTVTKTIIAIPTSSTNGSSNGGGSSFLDNTGAVAGTFTAVGLVGFMIIICLINVCIHRRRTRAYTRETDLAANVHPYSANPDAKPSGDSDVTHARSRDNVPGENAPPATTALDAAYVTSYPTTQERLLRVHDSVSYDRGETDAPLNLKSSPSSVSSPPPPYASIAESYASHDGPQTGSESSSLATSNMLDAAHDGLGSSEHSNHLLNPFGRDDEI